MIIRFLGSYLLRDTAVLNHHKHNGILLDVLFPRSEASQAVQVQPGRKACLVVKHGRPQGGGLPAEGAGVHGGNADKQNCK